MSASAVFILDAKGKQLISRNFRGDVPMSMASRFIMRLLEEDEVTMKPVINEEGITYVFVKHNGLFFLAISDRNINAMLTLTFLYKFIEVCTEYFSELCEESIRDNFVVIYELLDEMMDFGYPQTTESRVLQDFITQESHRIELAAAPALLKAVTGTVSWRTDGIRHKKNEVYLDVIESVNLLVSSDGTVLRSEILGQIKLNSLLSGMPELKLGLNDKIQFDSTSKSITAPPEPGATPSRKAIEMEDVTFHQCVRLSRFDTNHTISFIPPDGEFQLMSYRLTTHFRPLILIESQVSKHEHSRIEFRVKARSQFKPQSTANNVDIIIPVPPDCYGPKFSVSTGTCKYAPEKDSIIWSIRQFPGNRDFLMSAHLSLPSISSDDRTLKRPITVKFDIPSFTVSGIQVRYLKIVEKSNYQALPWVRYLTQSGDYQFRM
ncbi:clathrin-adaptor medium chain apm 1 [Pelomyxa schiedti]|nr:clathrin-adaptor medium chain apm 1 [Pelomyxa schiedti]